MSYADTFIRIAADCPETTGIEPPVRGGKKPVHLLQLELLRRHPYRYTHEQLAVESELLREDGAGGSRADILARIRSKPLPCLRTSPLAKRYGWGFHFDDAGRVAAVAAGTPDYSAFLARKDLQQVPAMRSKRER